METSTLEQHVVRGEGGFGVSPPMTLVPAAPVARMNTGGSQAPRPGDLRLGGRAPTWAQSRGDPFGLGCCAELSRGWALGGGGSHRMASPGASRPPKELPGFLTHMTHCRLSHPGEVQGGRLRESQVLACKGSSWSLGTHFPNVSPFSALEATSPPPSPGQVGSAPQAPGLRPQVSLQRWLRHSPARPLECQEALRQTGLPGRPQRTPLAERVPGTLSPSPEEGPHPEGARVEALRAVPLNDTCHLSGQTVSPVPDPLWCFYVALPEMTPPCI